MRKHKSKKQPRRPLTEVQKQAVTMLCIQSMRVQDVSAALGCHRCTIWRWKQNPEFTREWDRQLKAYIREWRKEMGYDQQRAARRAKLRKLEAKMKEESAKIRTVPIKAFDRAWNAYIDALFKSEQRVYRRR